MVLFSMPCRRLPGVLICAAGWLCSAGPLPADDVGIRAPEGFRVELFAADELAHDIYSMTLDSQGRVVVSGRDYVKTLHDDDRDGRADRATLLSSLPKSGAHGMLFLGNDLLVTGDESLMLLRDSDADGQADGEPEIWTRLRHPEHGANGIARGPDGWVYVICGNDAGVIDSHATTPGSPVKQPQSGAVIRFSPDGKRSEIVAHGFRNPYDLDFNAAGHLFTVDADGERDHHLPWYAPTRLFDVAQGMHHGWVLQGWQRSWNRPAYFPDSVERLVEIGRGSPTGLTVYRHTQFPERYRGSVLSCCWTLGRVYHLPLTPSGSTYSSPAKAEVFLETTGEVGFAPVDLAVGPAGELYVAIGGRRTQGSVFRLTYTGDLPASESASELDEVLSAPQPLAAWSRARWEPIAKKIGRETLISAILDAGLPLKQRLRAVEIVTDLFSGLSVHEASQVLNGDDAELSGRVLWSLGRQTRDSDALKLVVRATRRKDPAIQRAAWETLAAWPDLNGSVAGLVAEADWPAALVSSDRRIQAAALLADRRRDVPVQAQTAADLWRLQYRGKLDASHATIAAKAFVAAKNDSERLSAVRLLELTLGDINTEAMRADVYAGYTLNAPAQQIDAVQHEWGGKLAAAFPSGDDSLNLELARLLGMLGIDDSSLVDRIVGLFSPESSPQTDLHYLICLSRLPGQRSAQATEQTASGLAGVQQKMQRQSLFVSRNWPTRVGEAAAELFRYDPALPKALVADPQFNLPAQAILALHMPADQQQAAARKLIEIVLRSEGELRWTDELVKLSAALPDDEAFPALRIGWEDFAVRDAVIAVLARNPQPEDRSRFVASLGAVQADTVERSAKALARLGGDADENEVLAALVALKQACFTPEQKPLRIALTMLLSVWSGENIEAVDPGKGEIAAAYRPWFDWFSAAYPASAARLRGIGAVDVADWNERLTKVDWQTADAVRGRLVFERKACQKCHAGNSPLGPDLAGAAGRLSREDLLAAIVDPSKDVSPLFQTTQVVTSSGRVISGLIVYESPDGTLVQTTPDTTIRVAGEEIAAMRKSRVSLMPNGLLNDVNDQELGDLFAYLQTLKGGR